MEGNSLTSFENLCKIFEMRIKLDKDSGVKTSLDVLNNYEKYCKKIDTIYNSEFQKELKPLISPAVTLEKEKDRLRRLIKLLEDRLDRRVELEDRYYDTTGKYISGLQIIVSEGELEDKRERLSLVSKYLETSDEIQSVSDSIIELKKLLEEEENKKFEYENKNRILEDELYSSFMSVINSDEYYKNISEEEITSELERIRSYVSETKETLDITKESIGALLTSGLDDDYASYVEEAEKAYYSYKNKEIILKIYKLVTYFEDDFKLICAKRDKINDLINEKKELSDSLVIDVDNELVSFEKVVLLQCSTLDKEKEVLDNITNYTSRISFKEERLEELSEANSSVEILAILREYGLIDTYDTEDVVLEEEVTFDEAEVIDIPSLEEAITFEDVSESVVEEVYDPYRIVEINDYPKTLNVGLAKLKGEAVREKVSKKLNPNIVDVTSNDTNLSKENEVNNDVVSTDTKETNDAPVEVDNGPIDVNKWLFEDNKQDNNDIKVNTPVWEVPTEVEVNPVSLESVNSLPVWEAIKPEFDVPSEAIHEEINNIDIVNEPQDNNSNNSNMFWIPVSESKMEPTAFPNLNVPINNNINKGNEFVFPTINN